MNEFRKNSPGLFSIHATSSEYTQVRTSASDEQHQEARDERREIQQPLLRDRLADEEEIDREPDVAERGDDGAHPRHVIHHRGREHDQAADVDEVAPAQADRRQLGQTAEPAPEPAVDPHQLENLRHDERRREVDRAAEPSRRRRDAAPARPSGRATAGPRSRAASG